MASSFECDPAVARQVSDQLNTIRGDLTAADASATSTTATGSSRVDGAVQEFFADSSDTRQNLEQLLERAAGMLRGLSDGASTVDRSLTDALTPSTATTTGAPR